MPTVVRLANLVIPKHVVIEKYKGGMEKFRLDHKSENEDYLQEDSVNPKTEICPSCGIKEH